MVTLAAALLGRERLTPARSAALLVASSGRLLMLLGAGGLRSDPIGVALALATAVTYTGYILVADTVVHRLPPVMLSALVMAGAAVALAVRAAVTGGVIPQLPAGRVVMDRLHRRRVHRRGDACLLQGMRRTGPSTASTLSTFELVVTTALAALTLGEFLTPVQLGGGLLVLSSVVVVQLRPRRRRVRWPAPAGLLTRRAAAQDGSATAAR
jgi:drug/metabolite transporter (DMT)-like permease